MVAIVAGNGLGLFNASSSILGGAGILGLGSLGQGGGRAIVNAATGNLILQVQDEHLSGRGLDLLHLRTYNSRGALNDGDGDGWRWDGERTVVLNGTMGSVGSTVMRTDGDGHETVYAWDKASSSYISTEGSGAHDKLQFDSGPKQWVWTDGSSRLIEKYSAATGRLVSQADTSGNTISFAYDTSGRLISVTDTGSGQKLLLTYATVPNTSLVRLQRVDTFALVVDAKGVPTSVLGPAVKQVAYGYDESGRLTSVSTDLTPESSTDNAIYVTTYTYVSKTSTRIASIAQSDGTSVGFTYDSSNRIETVTDASGTQTFTYSVMANVEDGTLTYQTDVSFDVGDGNPKVWSYVSDGQQRLIEILAPAPVQGTARLSTRFQYDADGNVAQVTDARGNTVVYQYDSRGNRIFERDALGNTVTRTYDIRNQVLTETRYRTPDPDGAGAQTASDPVTTRFVYDDKSRLRFIVSADGRVSESRYGTGISQGLLTHSIRYTGGRYDVDALAAGVSLSEAQLTTWLASQDKTQVQQTQYVYDFRGNLSQRTDFASVNASGVGVLDAAATVTEYIYDGHGQLRQTITVRGSAPDQRTPLTSFEYDGLGRELKVISGSGTRTTVYDDAHSKIQVTNSAGLIETRSFDTRGRLISVSQSASGATRTVQYSYDSAGRLRMVEDAQGGQRFSFYDRAGRLQFSVDASGAVTGYEYNANGQVITQTRYRKLANTSSWYDRNTQTVTQHSLALGSDIVLDATHDRITRYGYDNAGRMTSVTDAANTVTQTTYDGLSQVTRQQSGDRVSRFFYDRDGHQVGAVDPLGYLTERKYDAAGRLIETLRYSTRSPAGENVAAPVWIGITNQTAIGNQPFEYRVPAYDPDGDSLSFSVVGSLPAWLTLDASGATPVLRGTPPATLTSYSVTLRATDARGRSTDVTFSISVGNTAPSWSDLPDSTVAASTSYSLILPAASDQESQSSQLTYSVLSTLPPGVTFDAAQRKLSGTPTVPGVYVVTVRVTDPQGLHVDKSFTLTVTDSGPGWTAVPVQQLRQGRSFGMTVPAAFDPEGQPLTYSVSSLPSWLSFDVNTRVLSGTPPLAGYQSITLRAQDASGKTVLLSFGLNVSANPPPVWPALPPMTLVAGAPASLTLPAAVDPEGEPLTFSVASGLPAGLSINAATGQVLGTTLAIGVHTVVLRVTDAGGAFVERSLTLEVKNAIPVFHKEHLGNRTFESMSWQGPGWPPPSWFGRVEFGISALAFTDGNGDALMFAATGMPSWLQFDPATRTFSGRVPAGLGHAQSHVITVTVNDGRGGTVSGTFTVTVTADVGDQLVDPGEQTSAMIGAESANLTGQLTTIDVDPLSAWRPSDTNGLRSYFYYDGQGRIAGSVDERGFLSELRYDAQANTQQSVRYMDAVTVAAGDTLATLKTHAGASQTSTVEYDAFGRVSRSIAVDGTVSRNEYDSAGRLVREVRAEGTSEQRASRIRYNAFGEVTGTLGGVGEASLPVNPTQAKIDAAIETFGVRYEYDSLGRKVKAIDANGDATLFFYDRNDRLTHTINAEREVTQTLYNAYGEVEATRHYANRITPENLSVLTGGSASQLQNRLPAVDSSKDHLTSHEYDRRGLLIKQTDAEGFVTTRSYTAHGQLATEIRAIALGKSVTTQLDYDLQGALLSKTADVGAINFNTRMTYDAFGRVIQSIDGAGKVVTTRYEDSGRAIVVTNALNRAIRSEYDAFGRVLKRIDAFGEATTFVYDDVARSVTVTTPEGVQVTTRKTRHGETLSVVDARGGTKAYEYDKDGRLKKVVDATQREISRNVYDNSGRLFEAIDARGTVTRLSYDHANRVIERRVDPDRLNLRTTYRFDELGRQIEVVEGAGTSAARVTAYEYDRKGQLRQMIVDPSGLKLSTRYTFDGLGNTLTVERGTQESPSQHVTVYEFDKLGRRIKEIAAPSAVFGAGAPGTRDLTTEYRYDAAGRLSRTIDAKGHSTWYVYDAAGQQIQIINAEGEVTQNAYDANGRLMQTRRHLNRLDAVVLVGLGDAPSAVTPASHANDARRYLVYDKDGRQRFTVEAARDTNWVVRENRYDVNGNVRESRRYDKFLNEARLEALDTSASPGLTVAEVTAELAALGYSEEDSTLEDVQRTHFSYDLNNRVLRTTDALGFVSDRIYDSAGNVLAIVRYAKGPTLIAGAIDAAVDPADPDNQVSRFAYDAAGRLRFSVQVLARDALGEGTQHLVSEQNYDALGRLVQSTAYATKAGSLGDYSAAAIASAVKTSAEDRRSASVYDAAGRQRYSIQVLTAGAQGQHVVRKQEYDALGRVVQSTAFASTMGLADFTKATLDAATAEAASNPHNRSSSFVYDALGRQRFVVAADGALSETLYDALGRVTETRRFDLIIDATTACTEAALSERRGSRAVGDTVTRGEKYTHDRLGRVLTTTDAKGFVETNDYNGLGDRTHHIDKNNATCTYEYDRLGRMSLKISPPVLVQLSGQSEPALVALEDRIYHDAFGNVRKTVERSNTPDARTTEYSYDVLGRLETTFLPGYYDPQTGRVEKDSGASEAGRFRREVHLKYDAFGNVTRTQTRTSLSTYQYQYTTYDVLGRVAHSVDALNHVTGFKYTSFGEQEQVTRYNAAISGAPANEVYWTADEIADQVGGDTLARTITTGYDNLGRKKEVTQPSVQSYFFSAPGSGTNASSAPPLTSTAITKYEYNVFGEVHRERVKLSDVSGGEWRDTWHYYDVMGRESLSINQMQAGTGYHTARSYDAFGNVKTTIEFANQGAAGTSGIFTPPAAPSESADDRITAFAYNARNQRTSVQRFGLKYLLRLEGTDKYVEVKEARDQGTTVESLDYDGRGNLKLRVDALGNATTFEYNAVNQRTKIIEPGRLVAAAGATDPFAGQQLIHPVTTLTLDAFGNVVTSERDSGVGAGGTRITHQHYDAAGNLTGTTDARGNQKHFKLDYAGRVIEERQNIDVSLGSALGQNSHTLKRRFYYDATGRQVALTDVYAQGATLMQSGQHSLFNAFGEVTEERRVWGADGVSLDGLAHAKTATYGYDDAGQRTTKTAADGTTRYFYNLAGQLTRQEQRGDDATFDGTSTRITETVYDSLGRVIRQRSPAFSAALQAASGAPAPTAATSFARQEYDRWGNVTHRTRGAFEHGLGAFVEQSTIVYAYNHDNKVIREILPTAQAWRADGVSYNVNVTHELGYDLMGRAVQESDVADDAATIANEAAELRKRAKHYDGAGQLIAEADYRGFVTHYAYNAHGNRVATKNALGTVFVDEFDQNGNVVKQSVIRASSSSPQGIRVTLRQYEYDQANRRYRTREMLDASGASVTSNVKHDERSLVRAHSNPSGVLTTFDYDQFGNKTREQLGAANLGYVQTWTYSEADDHTVGRLLSATAGSRTINYRYNDFGQVKDETRAGANAPFKVYTYHNNGLLKQVQSSTTVGTEGAEGRADFASYTDTTSYEYTVKGEVATETFVRTGQEEREERGPNFTFFYPLESITPITRTTYSTYDALGRMAHVWTPAQGANNSTLHTLEYSYDEMGNVRKVFARYTSPGTSLPDERTHWFDYDADGRMTIADGGMIEGKVGVKPEADGGIRITYDALGRRRTTETFERSASYLFDPNPNNDLPDETLYAWNEYRIEQYEYNDLSYLTATLQKLSYRDSTWRALAGGGPVEDPVGNFDTSWFVAESRSHDLLGRVIDRDVYQSLRTRQDSDREIDAPALATHTHSQYRQDGQLQRQDTLNHLSNSSSSLIYGVDGYDSAGKVNTYFVVNDGVTDTFVQTYSMQAGGPKENTITVTRQGGNSNAKPGDTINRYDSQGQLVRTVISNARGSTTRSFSYDGQGHITGVRETNSSLDLPTTYGTQDHVYVNGRQVATMGAGTLFGARFSFAYTPVSAANPNPSTYQVRSADTLAGIAREVFGDPALWYLIADANGVGFGPNETLPSTEVGKSYRIPSVTGSHNNANTFKPYNAAEIIGSTTPSVMLSPQALECAAVRQVVVVAVAVAIAAVATVATYGTLGPVLAAAVAGAASNLGGQATGLALGTQERFDGLSVAKSAGMGALSGLAGAVIGQAISGTSTLSNVARTGVNALFHEGIEQVGEGFEDWGSWRGGLGSLFDVGVGALSGTWGDQRDPPDFEWSGAISQVAYGAVNPQSGWLWSQDRSRDWTTIAAQAVGAFTQVAVNGGINRLRGQKDGAGQAAPSQVSGQDAGLSYVELGMSSMSRVLEDPNSFQLPTGLVTGRQLTWLLSARSAISQAGVESLLDTHARLSRPAGDALDVPELEGMSNAQVREFVGGLRTWNRDFTAYDNNFGKQIPTRYFDDSRSWESVLYSPAEKQQHLAQVPGAYFDILKMSDLQIAVARNDGAWIENLAEDPKNLQAYRDMVADAVSQSLLESMVDRNFGDGTYADIQGTARSIAQREYQQAREQRDKAWDQYLWDRRNPGPTPWERVVNGFSRHGFWGGVKRISYDQASAVGHQALSLAGTIPYLGVIPDAVDAVWTAAEIPFGKSTWVDLSLAGAGVAATLLPVAGDGAAALAKMAARLGRGSDAAAAAKLADTLVPSRRLADIADEATAAGIGLRTPSGAIPNEDYSITFRAETAADLKYQVRAGSSLIKPPPADVITHDTIVDYLRRHGSQEGLDTAELLSRGDVKLRINPRDPDGLGRGGYLAGPGEIHLNLDGADRSLRSAAGFAVHETTHAIQYMVTNSPVFTKAHEFAAYRAQNVIDPMFRTDGDIRIFLDYHPAYRDLPIGDPHWFDDNHHLYYGVHFFPPFEAK